MMFLAKFFPMGKTNALRRRISNFQQSSIKTIPEPWRGCRTTSKHARTMGLKLVSAPKLL
jgi:hypothetical protein